MNRFIKILPLVAFFVGMTFLTLWAQSTPPHVKASFSTDTIWIGDHFWLEVEVTKDQVQTVAFPSFDSSASRELVKGLEVLQEEPEDTISSNGRSMTIRKRYKLTSFAAGIYHLQGFPVLYVDKNRTDTLEASGLLDLEVKTFEIDTTKQQIYDLKPPMKMPLKPGEFLGWLVGGAWLAAILYILIWNWILWRKRRNGGTATRVVIPNERPEVRAIRELEQLAAEKLWQNNRHKLYYTRLTDIVRTYIVGRYGINSTEMTTAETMFSLDRVIPDSAKIQLNRLLTTADYVKFAKYTPVAQDNEMSYNDAYYFVETTKEIVEEQKEDQTLEGKIK